MRLRTFIAIALLAVACQHEEPPQYDADIRSKLAVMRQAIHRFHRDKGRYPYTLNELVPNYLRAIPIDPVTESTTTWQLITEDTVQPNSDFTTATSEQPKPVIIDVRSGAGAPYSTY